MRHPNVITACAIAAIGRVVFAQGPDLDRLMVVVEQRCAECHDESAHKGGLDIARAFAADPAARLSAISKIRDRVRAVEMPPSDADPMTEGERRALLLACDATLAREVPLLKPGPGRVTVRRLSRTHWDRCVEDLFGIASMRADAFPADDLGYGFDSIGDAMSFSTLHLEAYLAAAEDVAAQVFVDDDGATPIRTIEGEAMDLVRGPGFGSDSDVAVLYANATIGAGFLAAREGTFRISVHAGATQAGDAPSRMMVALDGRELAQIDVTQRAPKAESITLPIGEGTHRIEVAFVNDFWDPDNQDPARRDRNLFVDRVVVEGPLEPRVAPPQQQWLASTKPMALEAAARVMAARVFRGATDAEHARRLAKVAQQRIEAGATRMESMRVMLAAALTSPRFLFRIEQPSAAKLAEGAIEPVPPLALASRLSFLLWSSCPDEELLAAARNGELASPRGVRERAMRMLADSRADRIASDFAGQWLELRSLDVRTPDPALFPGFDDALRRAMRRETELLFLAVMREGRDVRDLLDADFTHVDARLARFYGIEGEFSDAFLRVSLASGSDARRGLLGHASWLAVTSNPTRTSPVKRGKWVMENLLDQAPPPPPPGNAIFGDEQAVATPAGLRAQLAAHRARSECAGCHERMDAFGFALEQYDAIGRHRLGPDGAPIDASSTLPSGVRVDGVDGLRKLLRDDPAFLRALLRKLFVYAVGRDATVVERLVLDASVDRAAMLGPVRFADLVGIVVESDAFRLREAIR